MENHFEICMTEDQLRGISSIGLAHMGDAVFELLVRGWLCQHGKATGKGLHQATIQLVRPAGGSIRRPPAWRPCSAGCIWADSVSGPAISLT